MPDRLQYLESVLEGVLDIITILEIDGKIRFESPAIRSLGYEPDELVGRNAFDFVHPEDRKRVLGIFLAGVLKPANTDTAEFRFRHKDGTWKNLEAVAKNLIMDPQVRGIVTCSRDITERRALEGQMRIQLAALEATANAIMISDTEGSIVWTNDAFTKLTGYSKEEAFGQNPRILKSGEQNRAVYEDLWKTLKTKKVWRGDIINKRKDGTLYFEHMTITPILDPQGEITHFVAIKQDTSESKKLEAQFRQAQKMEAVGRLAGGVAHDFNNLLTVILGRCEFLRADLEQDSKRIKDVQEIYAAGQRAAGLTRQLLAFSRKQILQTKVMDLNQVVRDDDKMLRRLMGEDVELVTILSEARLPVKIDVGQMEQVIMNLVVNARDAMPDGGKLIIETKRETVDAAAASRDLGMQAGRYVLLTVGDSGAGIPPEVKSQIFEPFFTTKEKGKGTGLGLSTVYGIVKQLNGFVYVDSEVGKGTTFRIYIPEVEDAAGAAAAEAPKSAAGSEMVLIVEDEEIVRGLAMQSLKRNGYEVLSANNGLEALRVIREHKGSEVKMMVTDLVMPHMGGSELADKISAAYPAMKMIFTSGYSDQSAIRKWIDQGYRFLQKPYTPSELLLNVREVLDGVKV